MAERIFRLFSLGFLSVGLIISAAGADKNGAKDLANATDQLIQHVTAAKETNEINSLNDISDEDIHMSAETEARIKADSRDQRARLIMDDGSKSN